MRTLSSGAMQIICIFRLQACRFPAYSPPSNPTEDALDPAPLRVETVTPCRYSAAAFVTFNRTPTSDEVRALHRLLVHYVNKPTVPCVAHGGGEV